MAFEDKYGILELVAAQYPVEKPIHRALKRVRDSLKQETHKKAMRRITGYKHT